MRDLESGIRSIKHGYNVIRFKKNITAIQLQGSLIPSEVCLKKLLLGIITYRCLVGEFSTASVEIGKTPVFSYLDYDSSFAGAYIVRTRRRIRELAKNSRTC